MSKKTVKMIMLSVCVSLFLNFVSAMLVDSEDFEGYTAYSFGSGGLRDWQTYYDLLVNQSGGRWNCTTASQYPTCLQCHDCYSGTYGGYAVYPSVDDSSQFLYIWSLNGTYSSFLERYYSTSLRFNHTNGMNASLYGSNFTWITKFKFRLLNYEYGAIFNDSHPLPLKSYYGFRPDDTGLLSYTGSATTWVRPRGGDIPLNYPTTSGNYYDYPSWRAFFPMTIGSQGTGGDQMVNGGTINEPRYNASPNCRVSDQEWHIFELYQYFNSTRHIQDVEIYLDGVLCSDRFLGTGSQLAIGYHQDYIDFETSAIFGIGIDDIRIYDNYTAPDGIPTCMDGLDNDNDTLIDYPTDPSCSYSADTENFTDITFQCNDGIDNDGDGFTDMSDQQCFDAYDQQEAPYDYTQCNNGVDDDGDGLIDLADPICNYLKSNPTEFPAQTTTQTDTPCLAEEFCLLNEKFPYTDNISLHGWGGNLSSFRVVDTLGSGWLYFDNGGSTKFNLLKNITNLNTYNNVEVWFDLAMATKDTWSGTDESIFYIRLLDINGKISAYLKFNLTQIDPLYARCQVYTSNGSDEVLVDTLFPQLSSSKILGFELVVDQVSKTYTVNYRADGEWHEGIIDYAYADATAGKVNTFSIFHPAIPYYYNSTLYDSYIDNINILGADTDFDTNCDTWESPYSLVESFNGYLAVCGWVTSHNIWNGGLLSLSQATTSYFAQRSFDSTITDVDTRYVTWMFDLNVINVTAGSSITVRGYDDTDFNFFTLWWQDTGDYLWYNQYGEGNIATTINLSQVYQVKIIMDMQSDNYDLYLNNILILDNKGWTKQFYNLQNFKSIKYTSARSALTLDNVVIYTSDATGNPLTPSGTITHPVSNTSSVCGLFYKTKPTCSSDEDCVTGSCLPNHQCNSFDMTYCDENGYVRGNKCILAGVASCFFGSATDLVFDNFFYVLIAIIMLIAIVYLSVMLRRR